MNSDSDVLVLVSVPPLMAYRVFLFCLVGFVSFLFHFLPFGVLEPIQM